MVFFYDRPNRWPSILLVLIVSWLGNMVSVVTAQGPSAPLPSEGDLSAAESFQEIAPRPVPPKLQQAPLDAVILYNAAGKRSIVLPGGWPLEVLDEFYKFLLKDQHEPSPPFTIQGIAAEGNVVGNRVETTIRFVLTTSTRIVRIPLGLKEGVLAFPPMSPGDAGEPRQALPYRYSGPGAFELIINPQDGQYVALIRPDNRKSIGLDAKSLSAAPATTSEPATDLSEPAESGAKQEATSTTAAENDSSPGTVQESLPVEQRHELTLSLWFPLARLGDEEQRLSISFPQAVASRFVLNVPMAQAVPTVSQGALLDIVETPDTETTQFAILGLKPNFDISWRKRKAEPVEERPVLNVEDASIVARLESKSTVYEATLPVYSPSGSFDRLRVRLPRGSRLDLESMEKHSVAGGYSFRVLPEQEREALAPPSNEESEGRRRAEATPVVEVRFPRKTSGPVKIGLKAIQQHPAEKPGTWRDLGGFDVIGAEQQRGFLLVRIPDEMRPNWKPIRGIRRVDLPSALSLDGYNARFEFFAQPFLLQSQIVQPQTRINVKPEYQVRIDKGTLTLTAHFSFLVLGSKTEKLGIQLYDWQWNGDIRSRSNVVDVEGVDQDANGLLTIPLRVPSDGPIEIELKAHRAISADPKEKQRLSVRLPRPDEENTSWTEPAALVVVPADNVEIVPVDTEETVETDGPEKPTEPASKGDSDAKGNDRRNHPDGGMMVGLSRRGRRSIPLRLDIPLRQQDPLIYQTESPDALFVADILYHRQKIAATIQTDVRLLDSEDQITEIISYDVAYEPVDKLFLSVPKSLEENGRLSIQLAGKTLEWQDVLSVSEDASQEKWARKRIMLPEAMIGRFQLEVRYGIPPIQVKPDMKTLVTLFLVRPDDAAVSAHQINMLVKPGVRIDLQEDGSRSWKPLESGSLSQGGMSHPSFGTAFLTTQPQEKISLLVFLADRDVLGTTVVERAWLQTWLTDTIRMDRGTYLITSNRDSISLWLPPAVVKEKVVVKLDRVPVPVRLSPKGELAIPLSVGQTVRPVSLEVWYQISEPLQRNARLSLPHFSEDALVRSEYWQMILPQNRHVIGVPEGWTPEYQWGWNGLFWGRIPSVRMDEIGLPGDASDANLIPSEANQYLFSSLHPPTGTSFYLVDRSVIVLFSSSLSLLVGLILIYFPKTRYSGSLLGLGLALIAMAVYQPAPVLLMLQASSFGVLLALGAYYVYRILYREEQWIVPRPADWNEASEPSQVYSVIVDETDAERKEERESERTRDEESERKNGVDGGHAQK